MVRSLNTKREVHLGKEEEEGESVYTMAAVGWQGRRSDSGQRSGNIIKADKIEIGNFPIATALFLSCPVPSPRPLFGPFANPL